jgi:hypothetical protein
MEHSLHLAAKHLVQAIAPLSPRAVASKVKKALQAAQVNGDVDLDILDRELVGFSFDDGDDESGDDDGGDMTGFDVGDSLGKALALVSQVCVNISYIISIIKCSLTHP